MQILNRIKNNEIVKGSFVLFLLFNFFNFLNYLFQLAMARMLGPGDYGVFASLMSFIYIFFMVANAIQLISAKYSSEFNSKNRLDKIHGLLDKLTIKFIKIAFLCFILFVLASYFISKVLDIDIYLIILTGVIIFAFFITPIFRGILHGMKKFNALGITMVVEGITKLAIGIPLVLLGWEVYGAIVSIILSIFLSFILSLPFIREVFKTKKEEVKLDNAYTYSFSVFYSLLIIFIMFSVDVLIAKVLFTSETVGMYAVASLIGKTIFFGTDPISKAMFPITSGKENNKDKKKSLRDATKILLLLCGGALVVFTVIPRLVVWILFGNQYLQISNIIWLMGLAYTFLAFSSLFIHYGLSGNKFKGYYILTIFPFITISLLYIFSSSLIMFSYAFVISNLLMLMYSMFSVRRFE